MQPVTIRDALRRQFDEEAAAAARLAARAPRGQGSWRPPWPESSEGAPPFTLDELIAHLLDALTGPCAVFLKLHPPTLVHFDELRGVEPGPAPAVQFELVRSRIVEGFEISTDADLARTLESLFHPEGQTAMELLLINLRHIAAHKYQLFVYLRILGVPLCWRDLYGV